MIVGVVPEPASTWPGLWMPELRYRDRQVTVGRPPAARSKRYMDFSETM